MRSIMSVRSSVCFYSSFRTNRFSTCFLAPFGSFESQCHIGPRSRVRVVVSKMLTRSVLPRFSVDSSLHSCLLNVKRPSGLLSMRLYDASPLLSVVPSHLRCSPDVHIPRVQIFFYVFYPSRINV